MEEANKSDQQFLDLTIVAETDLTDYGFKKSLCADKYLLQQQLK
jgi:hypothetical protein